MEISTPELGIASNDAVQGFLASLEIAASRNERTGSLNVEAVASSRWLPADRKWGIRFGADGNVTIVLGMWNYGRGCYSAYFASLVSARLGIPFRRVRLYYSANLPARLQTPIAPQFVPCRSSVSPLAAAAADVIEGMCDQVIERGRLAFAAIAGVETGVVGFDQSGGRFFVLNQDRSGRILEIAGQARGGRCVSVN
jgi:CO/xanthine dehydrogenase Mo-binding subunit